MAFFDKRKQAQTEKMLEGILDSQDADMLVVRGKSCQIQFMNKSAKKRLSGAAAYDPSCKTGFAATFANICSQCPNNEENRYESPHSFDVNDKDGKTFHVSCYELEWLDERPATALYLRDVTDERAVQQKLYNLAYLDHLTGIPNRQKLKEDFEALVPDIQNGKKRGLVAIFDLDNFKSVNDTYGHNTGDVMLRRLTEHFQNEPVFAGHVYRLGGDEFVLLYADPVSRFASEEEMRDHYDAVLQKGFLSYTMPNIEIACTISMGAAFFPRHGTGYSEILRKADIALYKAKEAGRNQKVFFEDQYDTAKKFKDLYINIQPILTHLGRTYGYELTDRGDENADGEDSLNLSEFDRTMDALGLGEINDDARYFIHFTNQLLGATVLNNLPKDKFVIQIPVTSAASPAQMKKYRELKSYGYSLALCGITNVPISPELMALADFCKFEPGALDAAQQRAFIGANPGKRFIATQVDTDTAFEDAQRRGYKLFQGFFFNQPVVVKKTKDIDPMKANYLRLLKLTSTDNYVNFAEISNVISSDVALSYKLLRLLNSAAVGLRNSVSSIEMAVAYLGEEHLKKWIALLALRGIASDKPLELVRMSLIRAQFGELLSPQMRPPRDTRHIFLVGMFSLLNIALEKSMQEVLDEIPVADEIRTSLLTDSGPHSDLLAFYGNYEYANWDEVSRFASENHLTDRGINEAYIAAVKWYSSLTD